MAWSSKTRFPELASKFSFLLGVLIFIGWQPEISAKLVAVCSSTTENTPNWLVLWFFTDYRMSDMGGPPAGTVSVEDQNGYQSTHVFSDGCDFGHSCTVAASQSSSSYFTTLLANCNTMRVSGKYLLSSSSKLTCFKHAQPGDNPLDSARSWGVGVTKDSSPADTNFVNAGATDLCSAFPIILRGRMSGIFGISLSNNDLILDIATLPDSSHASRAAAGVIPLNQFTYWLEIGVAGGGGGCTGTPSINNNENQYADGAGYVASFCGGVPDGFVCPVVCSSGHQKKSLLTCENGVWRDYFACASTSTLCEPPGVGNAAGVPVQSGWPVSTYFTHAAGGEAGCNYWSAQSSICRFRCEGGTGFFGDGYLRCVSPPAFTFYGGSGADGAIDCVGADVDAVWAAPQMPADSTTNFVTSAPAGAMRLAWSFSNLVVGGIHSEVDYFEFEIFPTGELHCDVLRTHLPPPNGYICSGSPHQLTSYIGTYEIRVRAINKAGPGGWSSAIVLSCDPFMPPFENHWWSSRYDVSACQQVGNGGTCQVACADELSTITPADFSCPIGTGGQLTGVLPACVLPANPPGEVRVTAMSTSSLHVTWKDNGLNDCNGDAFAAWEVSVAQQGTSTWTNTGCTGLTIRCIHECTLTGLFANTLYTVKVRATCDDTADNSQETLTEEGTVRTWPAPADPPSINGGTITFGDDWIDFEWDPSTSPSDCVLLRYEVSLLWPKDDGTANTWEVNPAGCEYPFGTTCKLVNLPCNTGFYFAVKQKCTDALADSARSEAYWRVTTQAGTCPTLASAPTSLALIAVGSTSLRLTWTAGTAHDCTFFSWQVQIARRIHATWDEWTQEEGCIAVFDRSTAVCTATNLRPATAYKFRVFEQCEDVKANSRWSVESSVTRTHVTVADPPVGVKVGNMTVTTLDIKWRPSLWNDCDFEKWRVILVEVNTSTENLDPAGCEHLYTRSITACTASGLASNMEYCAKVMVKCRSSPMSSVPSECSPAVKTLPGQAFAPFSIGNSIVTSTLATFTWDGISESWSDCIFAQWILQVKAVGSAEWGIPSGCDQITDEDSRTCTATLLCHTHFMVRVAAMCTVFGAQSLWRYSTAYTSGDPPVCSKSASPPMALLLKSPLAQSLFVSWTAGAMNDCVFSSWEVQMLQEGANSWVNAKGTCGSLSLIWRSASSCTAEGLRSGNRYMFRIREVCSASSLNSLWAVSDIGATAAGSVSPTSKTPQGVSFTLPTSLLMIYPEPVEIAMNKYTATFWATGCQNQVTSTSFSSSSDPSDIWQEMHTTCSAVEAETATTDQVNTCCGSTALGCQTTCTEQYDWQWLWICPYPSDWNSPDECGCDVTNCTALCITPSMDGIGTTLELLGNRILRYTFPETFALRGGCNYRVSVPAGMVRTTAVPISFSPAMEWYFVYNPPTELMTLTMVDSSTTGFTLSATFNTDVEFECSAAGQTTNSEYKGEDGPAQFQITGLGPATAHEVTCTAKRMDYPNAQACESVQAGALSPDDCIFISDDDGSNHTIVAESTRAPSSGKFCREISMVRGIFRTQPDVVNLLKSLTVQATRKCPDGSEGPATGAMLTPAFDRTVSGGTYTFSVDYQYYRTQCNALNGDVTVTYEISISAVKESETAALEWTSGAATADQTVSWPAAGPSFSPAAFSATCQVTPGSAPGVSYVINGQLVYQTFDIQSVTASNPSDRHALRTDSGTGTSTLAVVVWVDEDSLPEFELTDLKVFLGSFEQTTTSGAMSTPVAGKREFTLTVQSAVGMGVNLPVIIENLGAMASDSFLVSFAVPIIESVKKTVGDNEVDVASYSSPTTIRVSGSSVASFPELDISESELRIYRAPQAQSSVDWPPLGITVSSAPCGDTVNGEYRMVKPYFPMNDPYEHYLQMKCDVSKPVYIGASACLCSDSTNYQLWQSSETPTACGVMNCENHTGTDNPLHCAGEVQIQNINETIPTDIELTFSSSKKVFTGSYELRMPGSVALLSDWFYESDCEFDKVQWVNESKGVTARLCWAGSRFKFYNFDGSSSIGSLKCSGGYTKNPTSCDPSGKIKKVGLSSRRSPTSFSATTGLTNLCAPLPTNRFSQQLRCVLPGMLEHPLVVQIWARTGMGDTWVVVAENDETTEQEQLWVQTPVVTGISQKDHLLAGTGEFDITGTHFPGPEVIGTMFQLWGSWATVPPTTPVDMSVYQPLCKSVIRSSETAATCKRGGIWNASVLGAWSPNLFMQSGANVFSLYPLEKKMQISPVKVTAIDASDDYEVGPLTFTLTGTMQAEAAGPLEIFFHYNDSFNISQTEPLVNVSEDSEVEVEEETEEENGERRLEKSDCRRRRRRRGEPCEDLLEEDTVDDYPGNKTQCVVLSRATGTVTCTVNSSATIFGDPLPEIDYSHVEDPPKQYSVKGSIIYRGMVSANPSPFHVTAAFWTCDPGYYRTSRETRGCAPCEPGKYKSEASALFECFACEAGRFGGNIAQAECEPCGNGQTTNETGELSKSACYCMEGFYQVLGLSDCLPCPEFAYCQGFDYIPVATAGYWSPDGLLFWTCYPPSACLPGNNDSYNMCGEGRENTSVRCAECLPEHYRYRSNCFECTEFDHSLSLLAPFMITVVVLSAIMYMLKSHRRGHTVGSVIETEYERRARLRRESKWWRKCGPRACFQLIFPPRCWPRIMREMAAQSTVRMFTLALGRLQLLWAMGLMPVNWSMALKVQQQFLSLFVFDLEVMRIGCLQSSSGHQETFIAWADKLADTLQGKLYIATQLLQFLMPYAIILLIFLATQISTMCVRDATSPNYIHGKGAFLSCVAMQGFVMIVKHFADDLWFLWCTECEREHRCSKGFPLIYCNFNDDGWTRLFFFSIVDLVVLVIPCMAFSILAIYLSWCWQHGEGSGVDRRGNLPWYMDLSEFWVQDYKGYSHDIRVEAVHLREHMSVAENHNISLHRLWERCIHMVKTHRWKFVEKDVETRIFGLCANIEKARLMEDARKLNPKTRSRIRSCKAWCRHRRARKADARQKATDINKLHYSLAHCTEFIRETEFGHGIGYESLFWMYSWEYTLLLQKFFIITLALTASEEDGTDLLASSLFVQLLVMVAEVDLEPFEWNLLNDLQLAMDVGTVYTIIFVQLDWPIWQSIMIYAITVVTIAPIILKCLIPSLTEDQELDEDQHVVQKEGLKHYHVDMATYHEVLGAAGMRRLIQLQRRAKRKLRKKIAADPLYKPATAQDRRTSAEVLGNNFPNNKKEIEKVAESREEAAPLIDKKALTQKVEQCDKLLKEPVQSVLKFGWEGIKWPSNFTAMHLAANQGCNESIEILWKCKAELEKQDEWGRTPLDYAKQHNRKDAIGLLQNLIGKEQTNSNADVQAEAKMETVIGNGDVNANVDAELPPEATAGSGNLQGDMQAVPKKEGLQARAKKRPPRLRAVSDNTAESANSDASPDGSRRRGRLQSKARDKARTSLGDETNTAPRSSPTRARSKSGSPKKSRAAAEAPMEVVMF